MAVTYTATAIGALKSKVSTSVASTAGATSLDVVTVVHGLGTTPDVAYAVLRSVIATPSAGGAAFVLSALNGSVAEFLLLANDGGAVRANADFFVERYHSLEK